MVSFIINGKINFSSGGGFFLSIPLSCAFLPLFEESLARHFALCYNVRGIDGAPSFLRHCSPYAGTGEDVGTHSLDQAGAKAACILFLSIGEKSEV